MYLTGAASDTIFALASGVGRGAIAVLRISGTTTRELLGSLCGTVPKPRLASLRALRNVQGELLDRAIVLWLPGPASYTGEDSAELHLHGGRAVLDAVASALLQGGLRPADRGEFTRRAVAHGKMDLLAAEAVADLVGSETDLQRKQALAQLSGEQGQMLLGWVARLTRLLASQEALIDFPDDDLPLDVERAMLDDLRDLHAEIDRHSDAAERGERLRHGLRFVLIGAPNVGKSSLLNALAGRKAAIVSPHPGTTRDAVTVDLVLQGIPVTLIDTAGMRETADPVELEGIHRTHEHAEQADWVFRIVDAERALTDDGPGTSTIFNKMDLCLPPPGMLGVSAMMGEGLPELRAHITSIAQRLADPGSHPVLSRARHASALRDAGAGILSATDHAEPELRAEALRGAVAALGRLTGQISSEDVLDVVFSTFCIGK